MEDLLMRFAKKQGILSLLFFLMISVTVLPSYAQTTYALLVLMDGDVNIAPSVIKDAETIQSSLGLLQKENICQLNMTVMRNSENKVTTSDMIDWIMNLDPSKNDVMMIYYSGHGYIDEQKRHYFSFDEGDTIPRSEVIARMKMVDCRLQMLITDCCSNLVSLPTSITATSRSLGDKSDKKYYRDLFISHKGFLDITAASEGEYAWGNSTKGGYFTNSLFSAFKGDGSSFRTWRDVIKDAQDGTQRLFKETQFSVTDIRRLQAKKIEGQTPKAYSMPKPINDINTSLPPPKPDPKIIPPPSEIAPMILIPAGDFEMGIDRSEIPELTNWAKGYDQSAQASWFEDETPYHKVYLSAYYIDVYEVTNEMYKKFMDATGYKAPKFRNDPRYNDPKQPVVGVTWDDAKAYCEWAGKRLPTEAEWEKAARGGLIGKMFPWGDTPSHDYANYAGTVGNDLWEGSAPVGKFAPNGYGLYDMAGNVFEWCADLYNKDYYSNSPGENPEGPDSGSTHVVRGGGFGYTANFLRVSDRFGSYFSSNAYPFVGFRCAK
jgi:iron(II)-dependent oxidoreductase